MFEAQKKKYAILWSKIPLYSVDVPRSRFPQNLSFGRRNLNNLFILESIYYK